jgi:undecaprenyl phosphate-alpha-L-ara4FN deformylase
VTPTTLGLRVDVDTFRGTRDGVPRLLEILASRSVTATFFFTLGPDNMGRHLFRLAKPRFLAKIIRSRAPSLYGWDILIAGTCWPGRKIGAALGGILRDTEKARHEVGLHAWDHHRWQVAALSMPPAELSAELQRGAEAFEAALGRRPACSAAAGWICDDRVLAVKQALGFRYNSDCRGRSIFVPVAGGRDFAPQIPTTLPTYDEAIGRNGLKDTSYNGWLLERVKPGQLNVLPIHAEVEGMRCAPLFDAFLGECAARGIRVLPLGALLDATASYERAELVQAPVAGREGDVCWQKSAVTH